MFSIQHIIWIIISVIAIVAGLVYLSKKKPPLIKVLSASCIVCVASEIIKILSCIELYPSSDGSMLFPYLEMQHLPLHLCSIQIITIFYCRLASGTIAENKKKQMLLQFIYPTCALGAPFAILLPSVFDTTITVAQAFTHPIAYQTFLYHAMLIVLGFYIPMSGEVKFSWKTYRNTVLAIALLAFVEIYINSIFASPTYVNGELVSVDYITNFLFMYRTPIGVKLNTKLAWMIYVAILGSMMFGLVFLFYVPLRKTKVWEKSSR